MASPLEDLDELTLRCRNQKARLYIGEAVASYRAGAFRSSIVACWIAVCFDVIEKIRELALAGDKEAEKHVSTIETIQKSNDLPRALSFEKDLLIIAKEKFELISGLECIDLGRLQHDRNRCAHPSLTIDDQAYAPSAELARLHLHSAVTHLLQHPPAQGKYALDRLLRDIESEYFPTNQRDAQIALASGPLKRPRESLVRNLILILIKVLLFEKIDYKRRMRIEASLVAITHLHHEIFNKTLREKLTLLIREVPDASLDSIIYFLKAIKDSWQHLEPDLIQKIKNYVLNIPRKYFLDLQFLLQFPPLQEQAKRRVNTCSLEDINETFFFSLPTEIVDRLITIYLSSSSFESANSCAKTMMLYVDDFNADQVRHILCNVSLKREVNDSFQLGALITKLREHKAIPEDEFNQLLKDNNLYAHVSI